MKRIGKRVQTALGGFAAGVLTASLLIIPAYRGRELRSRMTQHAAIARYDATEQVRMKQLEALHQLIQEQALKLARAESRASNLAKLKYDLKDAAERGDDFCVRRLIHAGLDREKDAALKSAVEHNQLSTA